LFGRTYDMLTALSLAAVLMLAGNPLLVLHSGFLQLRHLFASAMTLCAKMISLLSFLLNKYSTANRLIQ